MLKIKAITPTIAILTLTILVSGIIVVKQSSYMPNKEDGKIQEGKLTNNTEQTKERQGDDNEEGVEVIISDIDTSNWKTYRNEEYGFEMQIPPDWIEIFNHGGAREIAFKPQVDLYGLVGIAFSNDKNPLSYQQIFDRYSDSTNLQEEYIFGHRALVVEDKFYYYDEVGNRLIDDSKTQYSIFIFDEDEKGYYILSLAGDTSNKQYILNLVYSIINSFYYF